jgi:hypothetical protein
MPEELEIIKPVKTEKNDMKQVDDDDDDDFILFEL